MIKVGSKVEWEWGNGTARGQVKKPILTVTKTIEGNKVTRKGEQGNKALYIEQEDGDHVLKLREVKYIDNS